jgi:hypothetical protein
MTDTSTLRIICLDPPAQDKTVQFGVQDKSSQLLAGHTREDGALQFEVTIQITHSGDTLDFAGTVVQGTKGSRFIYLSLGTQKADGWQWIRRLKVPLSGLTASLIQEAVSQASVLEAAVDGTRSGTVPLRNQGWVVKPR